MTHILYQINVGLTNVHSPVDYCFSVRLQEIQCLHNLEKNIFIDIVNHTIRKCEKMAGQNTFQILLLNDANMIGEH